jgi:hypothetical protein
MMCAVLCCWESVFACQADMDGQMLMGDVGRRSCTRCAHACKHTPCRTYKWNAYHCDAVKVDVGLELTQISAKPAAGT